MSSYKSTELRRILNPLSVTTLLPQLSPRASISRRLSSGSFSRQSQWVIRSEVMPCLCPSCTRVRLCLSISAWSSRAKMSGFL